MDGSRWRLKAALIAVGAGWLAGPGLNTQCQAQIIRQTSPLHLDDRHDVEAAAPAGYAGATTAAENSKQIARVATFDAQAITSLSNTPQSNSPLPNASQLDASSRVPPPLPMPSSERASAPKELKSESDKSEKKSNEADAKKKSRKSYLPEQKPISQISIDVSSKAKGGKDLRPESVAGVAPTELPAVMAATASELHMGWSVAANRTGETFPYKPLYFEEVNLERYGRSVDLWQPAISTTRFFATVPLLPYKMVVHSPHRPYYWSWPYPAGTSAPPVKETFPIQPKAALVEAGVLTGAAFLIP